MLRISSAYYLPCVLVPSNALDKTAYSGNLPRTFTPVTEQFPLEILQKTVPKSCDLNPISTKLLYENLQSLTLSSLCWLLVLYRHQTSKVIVQPLLKKPSLDQNVLKNYSLISDLPFLSKILEKIVLESQNKAYTPTNTVTPASTLNNITSPSYTHTHTHSHTHTHTHTHVVFPSFSSKNFAKR